MPASLAASVSTTIAAPKKTLPPHLQNSHSKSLPPHLRSKPDALTAVEQRSAVEQAPTEIEQAPIKTYTVLPPHILALKPTFTPPVPASWTLSSPTDAPTTSSDAPTTLISSLATPASTSPTSTSSALIVPPSTEGTERKFQQGVDKILERREQARRFPAQGCRHWAKWVPHLGMKQCEGFENGERCTCDRSTRKPSGKHMLMWTCNICKNVFMCERHKRKITDHSNVYEILNRKTGL